MTDVGSHHFVKSSDRVLVPQPSDDPHDPLVSPPLFAQDRIDLSEDTIELTRNRIGIPFGKSLPWPVRRVQPLFRAWVRFPWRL